MLFRTLHNIAEGRISKDYNPYSFIPGEKLKFKKSVAEFVGIDIDKHSGLKRIFVRFKDGINWGIPLETAPFLQHVRTKCLSKFAAFNAEYRSFLKENPSITSSPFVHRLSDYKTHLESS
jgi:hypothetical protein